MRAAIVGWWRRLNQCWVTVMDGRVQTRLSESCSPSPQCSLRARQQYARRWRSERLVASADGWRRAGHRFEMLLLLSLPVNCAIELLWRIGRTRLEMARIG